MRLLTASDNRQKYIFVFIIGAILLLSGCSAKNSTPPIKQIGGADFLKVSKPLQVDMPDCTHLEGVKIHTSFTTGLHNYTFLETRDALRNPHLVTKVKRSKDSYPYMNIHLNTNYAGDLANDFTAAVNYILSSQCRAVIVNNPRNADVTVSGSIKKFHSQIIDKIDKNDGEYGISGASSKMNIASIAYIESSINNEEWTYEELMNISYQNHSTDDTTYELPLAGGSKEVEYITDIKTYLHNEFLLSQYSEVTSIHRVKVLLMWSTSTSMKSTFKIYNDDDGALLKAFKDIEHTNKNTSQYQLFNQYRKLYTTGFGNQLYLLNDYTKQIIERIPDKEL